jgi:hypothetical protein
MDELKRSLFEHCMPKMITALVDFFIVVMMRQCTQVSLQAILITNNARNILLVRGSEFN